MSARKKPATRTRVGKYELGKTVGEGSFAKVKFARNLETADNVAIKILDRDQVLRHKMVEHVNTKYPFASLFLTNYQLLCFHFRASIKWQKYHDFFLIIKYMFE